MSKQLKSCFEQILKMGYVKNEHAGNKKSVHGHEAAIEEILISNGFSRVSNEIFQKIPKDIVGEWTRSGNTEDLDKILGGMQAGQYICQPLGTQSFPDIILKNFDGRYFAIECKSTKSANSPMWNDKLPVQNGIYIFSSKKFNKTTIFLGKDVLPVEYSDVHREFISELSEIVNKYKPKFNSIDRYKRGWYSTFRPQNFQGGGKSKNNYFTHPDRQQCEKNVLSLFDVNIVKSI